MAEYCDKFLFNDENGDEFLMSEDGGDSFQMWQGRIGPYYTPDVSPGGTLSWTNNGGLPNPPSQNIRGPAGRGLQISGITETVSGLPETAEDGAVWLVGTESPYEGYCFLDGSWEDIGELGIGPTGATPDIRIGTVTTGAPGSSAAASMTGTAEEPLLNLTIPAGETGADGAPGEDGADGTDGVSPEVTITAITGGHRVTITDADHPNGQSFDVMDGEDGTDGVSPEITITTITGGHRVTITDADHPTGQSFDVMDGDDAPDLIPVVADAYDSTASYAVGDYCTHNDKMWRCNTAIGSGGEAWNSAHWTEVTVGEELTGVKTALDSLDSDGIANASDEVSGTTVTDAIDNLNAVLQTVNVPITIDGGISGTITAKRNANVVSIAIDIYKTGWIASSYEGVGTVPNDITPSVNIMNPVNFSDDYNNDFGTARVIINTFGRVSIWVPAGVLVTRNYYATVTISYIL